MAAITVDGDAGSSTGEGPERLHTKPTSLGPARTQLISKGLIYSPEYGRVAFTVPGRADFIQRLHHEL